MEVTPDNHEPTQRLNQLEREVHALNANFTTVVQRQSEQGAQIRALDERLERVGLGVDRLVEKSSQGGWNAQAVLIAVGAVVGLVWGIAQYLELQINPMKKELDVLTEFRMQTHHEFGKLFEWQEGMKHKFNHFDDLYHDVEQRLIEEEKKSAASIVSRRAMGDYLKEHTNEAGAH